MKNTLFLLAASMLIAFAAQSQIVYTDVNPDISCGTCNHGFDVNGDGLNDFTISQSFKAGTCNGFPTAINTVSVTPKNGSALAITGAYPSILNSGSLIDSSFIFQNASDQILASFGLLGCAYLNEGNWVNGANDKFLGLRLKINGNYYYAWVRLDLAVHGINYTIKDYGYNSVPNQSILVGQTCPPQAVTSPSGSITFCAGDSAILSSVNSGSNLSYKWKLNGANISGATNKSYSAKTAGKYAVKVTDNTNGCTATSAKVKVKVPCKIQTETSIVEANQLSIHTNPNSGVFNLQFQSNDESATSATIEIRNELGQLVFQKNYLLNSGLLQQQIDLSSLRAGVYNVIVHTGTQVIMRTIVIQ